MGEDIESLRAECAALEGVLRALADPPAEPSPADDDPAIDLLIDRALDRLEAEIVGRSEGNPNHDAEGKFASGPGGGGGGEKPHGKHYAKRQRRKKRKPRKPRKVVHKTTGGKKGVDTRVKLTKSAEPKVKDQARVERARAVEKRSTASVQRVGERNEATLIEKLGGTQGTDNGAVDVVRRIGGDEHGIEVKTIVNKAGPNKSGTRAQIKCEADQKARKEGWKDQKPGRELHTVVFDHRDRATDEAGNFIGVKEAHSGHELYYRRGVGAFTLGGMEKVKSWSHMKELMAAKPEDLPPKARPPAAKEKP